MNDSPLKIPARTSSLFAPTRRSQIDDLEINLKRKASQMSTASQSSTAYIDCAIEYQTAKYQLYSEAAVALRESFENNVIVAEEMKDKVKEMTRKRLKAATSMTNLVANRKGLAEKLNSKEQDQREAYQAAIANSFRMSNITKMQVRDNKAHDHWKKNLDRYQKAMRIRFEPQGKDEEPLKIKGKWCPVLQRWSSDPKERVAAYIIPHFMGFENVAWMLGDKGDYAAGWSHIWSLKNGMIMSKYIEQHFNKGQLAILPLQTPEGKPQRLRVVILDPTLHSQPVPEVPGTTFKDYDNCELVFKGDGRPGLRYLYWHYVTSILRLMNYGDKDEIKKRFPGSKMWPSDGSYFRRSTLKPLAKYIGDYDVEESDFSEGLFSGVDSESEVLENAIAADVANLLENYEEQDCGDEMTESESEGISA